MQTCRRQEAADGMEGAGGKCRHSRWEVSVVRPTDRPLARAESPKRSTKSAESGRSEPSLKNVNFWRGRKGMSVGV